jgi:2-polyprenyl-3-methyl-5-hydroxy-6-metoxy-1,4-benzoquinol methylase
MNTKVIQNKIPSIDKISKQWGDSADSRFYVCYQLQKIQNKDVLDIGAGVGNILSFIDNSNRKSAIDLSEIDLKVCEENGLAKTFLCNAISTPFSDKSFDIVICCNVFEVLKQTNELDALVKEIKRLLRDDGQVWITTPNNAYYKTIKLSYDELNAVLKKYFTSYSIEYFNCYPKTSKNRKLNLNNIMPKILIKLLGHKYTINHLIKKESTGNFSKSFVAVCKQ